MFFMLNLCDWNSIVCYCWMSSCKLHMGTLWTTPSLVWSTGYIPHLGWYSLWCPSWSSLFLAGGGQSLGYDIVISHLWVDPLGHTHISLATYMEPIVSKDGEGCKSRAFRPRLRLTLGVAIPIHARMAVWDALHCFPMGVVKKNVQHTNFIDVWTCREAFAYRGIRPKWKPLIPYELLPSELTTFFNPSASTLLDIWVHDAIVTNQSLVPSPWHKILPVHATPPKLLSLVAIIIAELFLEKLDFKCHNLLSSDDQCFVYFCHDFDISGWYLMASWAMFFRTWFHVVIVELM